MNLYERPKNPRALYYHQAIEENEPADGDLWRLGTLPVAVVLQSFEHSVAVCFHEGGFWDVQRFELHSVDAFKNLLYRVAMDSARSGLKLTCSPGEGRDASREFMRKTSQK